jgi:hypothetical protein
MVAWATYSMVAVNVVVWLFVTPFMSGDQARLSSFLLNYGISHASLGGLNPITFITYMFIHENSFHVLLDVFLLLIFGRIVERHLEELKESHRLITFGELVDKGVVEVSSGVEVGKLAYGTGTIPFIRTSDIVNWEVRIDPTHSVSEEVYNKWRDKCPDLKPEDILMVRDGTYLVGNTAMITEDDIAFNPKMLFQAEVFRIRVLDRGLISPYLLFGILNSPIVRRQIRCKQFTRGVIDTLGNRVNELILPIPKDEARRLEIEQKVREIIEKRSEYRSRMRDLINTVTPKYLDYKWKPD